MKQKLSENIAIPGFQFAGFNAGIKSINKTDLTLIHSETPCVVGGVFTTNQVCAAPVRLCRKHLKTQKGHTILVNSGNANAATGKKGEKDCLTMATQTAQLLNLETNQVFICSTGKIGAPLPMPKINKGISEIVKLLSPREFHKAHQGILTTDAFPKLSFKKLRLNSKTITLALMAKGAGMIEPNMATMLAFLVTDLNISKSIWQKLIKEVVSETLNCLTVDGDMSTNDTVLAFANGLAKNTLIKQNDSSYYKLKSVLLEMFEEICIQMAQDGEGATKCSRIYVTGAKTPKQAQLIGKAIANSQLFKTAQFGSDPNWGRILCAAGYSGAQIKEKSTVIKIGETTVFTKGTPLVKNEKKASRYLAKNDLVDVHINLNLGKGSYRAFSSDLTYGYIKVNAEYRT